MVKKNVAYDESLFNSRLSFQPLLNTLKKNISDGKPGAQKLYGELIQKIETFRTSSTVFRSVIGRAV